GGAPARADTPCAAESAARAPGRRSPPRSGRAPRVARRRGARSLRKGVRSARAVHAPSRADALPPATARRSVGHELRESLQPRRRLRPLRAREDRQAVRLPLDRNSARRRLPASGGRRMSALPLRLRLTLAFAIAMAALLAAMGLFVYARVGSALLSSVDQALRSQAVETVTHPRERSLIDPDIAGGAAVAQLLDPPR